MLKKMKLPFRFKTTEATASWPWLPCGNPKTLSFRAGSKIFKTTNSAAMDMPTESWFNTTSESGSFWLELEEASGGESIETVIRGLRSAETPGRLFFEPGETSSILEEAKTNGFPFKESTVVMAMDSKEPYMDFKRSMEEMVEAHGLKDWECLEELLSCYLRVNGKNNYGYIVGAFVDLLLGLAFASSSSCSTSSFNHEQSSSSTTTAHSLTSPLSFSSSTSSSPFLSLLEIKNEIEKTVAYSSSSSDA
ncbi:hypothetical protein ACSBR1_036104 [Camellia fascicularis]